MIWRNWKSELKANVKVPLSVVEIRDSGMKNAQVKKNIAILNSNLFFKKSQGVFKLQDGKVRKLWIEEITWRLIPWRSSWRSVWRWSRHLFLNLDWSKFAADNQDTSNHQEDQVEIKFVDWDPQFIYLTHLRYFLTQFLRDDLRYWLKPWKNKLSFKVCD